MKIFLLLVVLLVPLVSNSQEIFQREKRDNIWLFGSFSLTNPIAANIVFDYNEKPVDIHYEFMGAALDFSNASICDTSGNLLLYTNGISIANFTHDTIENGGRINPGEDIDDWVEMGLPIVQGALLLAAPERDSLFYIFYEGFTRAPEINAYAVRFYELFYALIDMKENDGLGKVIEKDVPIIQDTLDAGKIVSTRHANGRDWWVVVPEFSTNGYYRFLLTPEGIIDRGMITAGESFPYGLGQSKFSPNGTKYVHFSSYTIEDGQFVSIYDFDRSTGLLDNQTLIMYNDTAFSAGIAISENSRFLYVSSYQHMYQYDLEAEDIEASKVVIAEYDGYYDTNPVLQQRFFMGALAPDGQILINSPTSTLHLHVIHEPNKKGLACNVEQHGIPLPAYNQLTMPNFPYYGLGPLDGSPADTLGIDNPPPTARFEYVHDSTDVHEIAFFDATLFPPAATMYIVPDDAYYWRFGDGEESNEQHPIHTYVEDGIYEVCLTVTNYSGSDTWCDTLYVNVIGVEKPESLLQHAKLFPNPVSDHFYFDYVLPSGIQAMARLYDVRGQLVKERGLKTGNVSQGWDVRDLASGVYFFVVSSSDGILFREKVVMY